VFTCQLDEPVRVITLADPTPSVQFRLLNELRRVDMDGINGDDLDRRAAAMPGYALYVSATVATFWADPATEFEAVPKGTTFTEQATAYESELALAGFDLTDVLNLFAACMVRMQDAATVAREGGRRRDFGQAATPPVAAS
jgi:hypothetical protein